MADFNTTYSKWIQPNEGYFADLPGDSGGITYGGIAYNYHPDWNGWPIVKAFIESKGGQFVSGKTNVGNNARIPAADLLVKQFFLNWWNDLNIGLIKSQDIANISFDWIVNSERTAPKKIQGIVGVTQDGVIGADTIKAINRQDPSTLNNAIKKARTDYYISIATGKNATFLDGWLKRINKFPTLAVGIGGLGLVIICIVVFVMISNK